MTTPQVPASRSKPVVWLGAVAAGATAATGVLGTVPGVPTWLTATVACVGAVALAVGGVLITGQVTPWAEVAAKQDPHNPDRLMAGPAAPGTTKVGQTVDVLRPPAGTTD